MRVYTDVRSKCEESIHASGLNATIVRPWYVLGPGHRWPYALLPFYGIAEMIPSMREGAQRLGLVTIQQMINTLARVTNDPASGVRVLEVPQIRRLGS